jgi:histone H1/5
MSYKAGIIEAITELKDRTGSSMISIKKFMMTKIEGGGKKWMNATFLAALKAGVAAGELVQVKNSYKVSAEYKKKAIAAAKKKAEPKKKAPKKKTTAKKSAVKKTSVKKTTATKKKVRWLVFN